MTLRHSSARVVTLAVAVLVFVSSPGSSRAAHASTTAGGLVARHNELLGTDPPDRAQLATGPARVTLTFDLPAQRGLSTVVVTGPDGHSWQAGPATEQGALVVAPVRPLGPAGDYRVAWRIVSVDGHPVRGTFQFTLTTPGPGTAATPPPGAGSATGTGSAGTAGWPWLIGAGALLVAGVVLVLRVRRTRRS